MKRSFGMHLVRTRRALPRMGHSIVLVSSILLALTVAHAALMRVCILCQQFHLVAL